MIQINYHDLSHSPSQMMHFFSNVAIVLFKHPFNKWQLNVVTKGREKITKETLK